MIKLARIHIAAIGLVIIIAVGVGVFMTQIKPAQERMTKLQADIDAAQQIINTIPAKEEERTEAQAKAKTARAAWEQVMKDKMSAIKLDDLHKAMFALNIESPTYGPRLDASLNYDPKVKFTGATAFSGIGWKEPTSAAEVNPRDFPQTIPLEARDFTSLTNWLRNTNRLSRVLTLGNTITLTAVPSGIMATVPGTVRIYNREPKTAQTAPTTATTPAGGGMNPMMGPMMGSGMMMGGGMGQGMKGR